MSNLTLTRLRAPFQFPTPYQVHLMVGALAGAKRPSQRQCLHHFDHAGTNAELWILTKEPLAVTDLGAWKAETQTLDLSHIQEGQQLGFRVRLNPSICVHGKRKDLVEYGKSGGTWEDARFEAVKRWFGSRVANLGFQVEDFALEGHRWRTVDKPGEPVGFGEIDVAGVMTVTDKAQLVHTVENGVGRERAFGCGLLFLYEMV